MNKQRLVYVGFGFNHHLGGHAGYHQIKKYLDYDIVIDAQKYAPNPNSAPPTSLYRRGVSWFRRKFISKIFWGYGCVPWYLFKCAAIAFFKGNSTFHFIYGENLYRNLSILHKNGCRCVCTLHQPFEWFKENPKRLQVLKTIDHIILVGEKEISLFEKATGKKNVSFIPHGICSDFYKPSSTAKKENMLLTVGNWLRDYSFADKVYQHLLECYPELRIVVVSTINNKKYITPGERISFLSGISDDELCGLYQRTSCLFLPLIRYTANNALLEASAVGCNIIIASDNPDNSYLPDKMIEITEMKIDSTIDAIRRILRNPGNNIELSNYVNNNYSWGIVADKTKSLLLKI